MSPRSILSDTGDTTKVLYRYDKWWVVSIGWLSFADAKLPVGDFIFVLGIYKPISTYEVLTPPIYFEENGEIKVLDVTYPGDDSTKAPGEGYEWKGTDWRR